MLMFWRRNQMYSENLRRFGTLEDKLTHLEHKIYGNGDEGMIIKLDRLNENQKFHQKVTWVILATVLSSLVHSIWPWVADKIH